MLVTFRKKRCHKQTAEVIYMTWTACSTDSMSLTFIYYHSAAYIDLHLENHSFAIMPKRDNTGIQRLTKLKTDSGCVLKLKGHQVLNMESHLLWGT